MISQYEINLTIYSFKFVVTLGVLFFVGIPLSSYIHSKLKFPRSFISLAVLSMLLSETLIYSTLMCTYISPFINHFSVIVIEAIFFLLPLIDKDSRRFLRELFKIRLFNYELGSLEIVLISAIGFLAITTFLFAMISYPVLDDPLIEWMYFGKQILLSGSIPLVYGNDAGISWSGNYPPMKSFVTAFLFLNAGKADPFLASLFPWLYGIAGLIVVYAVGRELKLPRIYSLIAVLIADLSAVYSLQMLGWGYADTVTSFNLIAFVYFWLRSENGKNGNMWISLLALSVAILSNYLALFVAIFAFPILFGYLKYLRKLNLKQALVTLGLGFLVLSWFVRNWLLVYDPVYPYLFTIFPARGIQASIIRLIPIYKEHFPNLFIDRIYTGLMNSGNQWPYLYFGVAGGSILLIYFIGSALFSRSHLSPETKRISKLLVFSLLSFLALLGFIYIRGGFYRYLMFDILPLSCVSGVVLFKLEGIVEKATKNKPGVEAKRNWKLVFQSFSVLVILLLGASTTSYLVTNGGYNDHPADYPAGYLQMVNFVNHLPPGTLATNDIREFFINRSTINFYDIPALFTDKTNFSIHNTLLSYNISYIYISLRFDYSLLVSETYLITAAGNTTFFTLLYKGGDYLIYGVDR